MLAQKRTQKRTQEAQREVVMTDNLMDVMQSDVVTTGKTVHWQKTEFKWRCNIQDQQCYEGLRHDLKQRMR